MSTSPEQGNASFPIIPNPYLFTPSTPTQAEKLPKPRRKALSMPGTSASSVSPQPNGPIGTSRSSSASRSNSPAPNKPAIQSSSDRKRKLLSRNTPSNSLNLFTLEFAGPFAELQESTMEGSAKKTIKRSDVRKYSVDHGRRGALESANVPMPLRRDSSAKSSNGGSPLGNESPVHDAPHSAPAATNSSSPRYHIYSLSADDMLPTPPQPVSPLPHSSPDDTSPNTRPIYNANAVALLPGRIFPIHPGTAPIGSRKRKNSLQLAQQSRWPKSLPTSNLLKEHAERQARGFPQKTITTWHELLEHLRQCRVEEDLLKEIETVMERKKELHEEGSQTCDDHITEALQAAAPISQAQEQEESAAPPAPTSDESSQAKTKSAPPQKILDASTLDELLHKMSQNRNKKRPPTKANTERKRPPSLHLKKLSVQADDELHEWKSSPLSTKELSFSPVLGSSPPTKKSRVVDSSSSDSDSSDASVSSNAIRLKQRRTRREAVDSPTSVNNVLLEMHEMLETIFFPLINGAEHDRAALTDLIAKVNKLSPSIRKRMRFELDVQRKAELEAHELEAKLLQSNYRLEKANEQIKTLKNELKRHQQTNGKSSKRKQASNASTPSGGTSKSRVGPLGEFHSKKLQVSALEENIREYSQKLLAFKREFMELTDGATHDAKYSPGVKNFEQDHLEVNEKLVQSQIRMREELEAKDAELERLRKDIEHMHAERDDLLRRNRGDRPALTNQRVPFHQESVSPAHRSAPSDNFPPESRSTSSGSAGFGSVRKDRVMNRPTGLTRHGSMSPLGVHGSSPTNAMRFSNESTNHEVYRSMSPSQQYQPMSRSPSPPNDYGYSNASGSPSAYSAVHRYDMTNTTPITPGDVSRLKHGNKSIRPSTGDAHRGARGKQLARVPVKQLTPFTSHSEQHFPDAPLQTNAFPSKPAMRRKQNIKRTSHVGTLLELSESVDRRDPMIHSDDEVENEWRM